MESSGSRALTPASSDLSSHANPHPVAFCPTAEAGARRTCEGKLAVGARWIWREKFGAFNSQTSDTGKFLPVSTERVGDDG